MTEQRDPLLFDDQFKLRFLAPKYWPSWLAIICLLLIAFIPAGIRDVMGSKLARLCYRSALLQKRKEIALINLRLCFPEKSIDELEVILLKNFEVFCQLVLATGEVMVRSKRYFLSRFEVVGMEHLQPHLDRDENLIFLNPHCYSTDFIGLYLSSLGSPMTIMVKRAKNEVFDWLMAKRRLRFGGAIYERTAGIKTLIKAVRKGYNFLYLPDEDHGPKLSKMCQFFGTQKATLPSLGPLAKASRAKVIPVMGAYRSETGKMTIYIEPPMDNFPIGDAQDDAQHMSHVVERLISLAPEQYMWTLMILKTRPEGELRVYPSKHHPYRKVLESDDLQ